MTSVASVQSSRGSYHSSCSLLSLYSWTCSQKSYRHCDYQSCKTLDIPCLRKFMQGVCFPISLGITCLQIQYLMFALLFLKASTSVDGSFSWPLNTFFIYLPVFFPFVQLLIALSTIAFFCFTFNNSPPTDHDVVSHCGFDFHFCDVEHHFDI